MTAPAELASLQDGDEATPGRTADPGEVNTLVDIYSRHERRIYRYCLALLRNPDDAEDATQETFTRAAPFLPNLAGDLSAYLTTVARNICCDVVRSRARRHVPIEKLPLPDRSGSPERQSVDWDVVRRMWRQLSPSERLLFAYTFAGYRYEEIALRTGMSRPSVSVGLARARRRLRDLATAIGALGLLPLGLRRLLDRIASRVNSALAAGQEVLAGAVQQAGLLVVTLLAGMATLAPNATSTVSSPAIAAIAYHGSESVAVITGTRGVDVLAAPPASMAGSAAAQRAQPPSAPSSTPTPPPPLPPLVDAAASALPGGTATPNDTSPDTVTVSPNYGQDHTVFLTAGVQNGCANAALCEALFRSNDAGASWTRLGRTSFSGGDVLLSPAYPTDPAVFIMDPKLGLLESDNGDGNFTATVPTASAAAMAPDSSPGHARLAVILSTTTLATHVAGTAGAVPGPALPPGLIATDVAFATPDRVVVSGWVPGVPSASASPDALVVCSLSGTCGPVTLMPDAGTLYLSLSSPATGTGPVLARTATRLYASKDGLSPFQPVLNAPPGQVIRTASVGSTSAGGTRIVVTLIDTATIHQASVLYSDDLGATFTAATGNLDATGPLIGVSVLPTGDMLAALSTDRQGHFALRQSTGNGAWTLPR